MVDRLEQVVALIGEPADGVERFPVNKIEERSFALAANDKIDIVVPEEFVRDGGSVNPSDHNLAHRANAFDHFRNRTRADDLGCDCCEPHPLWLMFADKGFYVLKLQFLSVHIHHVNVSIMLLGIGSDIEEAQRRRGAFDPVPDVAILRLPRRID